MIIGTKTSMAYDVSIKMMPSEYVILVYPDIKAPQAIIMKLVARASRCSSSSYLIKSASSATTKINFPRAQPMMIPGKKIPAGTFVPYVVIVNKYQMHIKISSSGQSIVTLWLSKFLMISPSADQKMLAIISY